MGAKRKVTRKVYEEIKKVCKVPKDDKKIMKKYGLSQTTVRAIRRSNSYVMFVAKTSKKIKVPECRHDEWPDYEMMPKLQCDRTDTVIEVFAWVVVIAIMIAILFVVFGFLWK